MSPENNLPSIVEPKEFLIRPFDRIEVGILPSSPNIDLLRFLTTLPNETGLVLQRPTWYVIKASEYGIPTYLMPQNSDTLLHSHPIVEDEENNDGAIPSINDFLNASNTAKNFIVSNRGLTTYSRIEDDLRREFERELYTSRPRFGRGTQLEYLKFLKETNAQYEITEWKNLNEKELRKLIS